MKRASHHRRITALLVVPLLLIAAAACGSSSSKKTVSIPDLRSHGITLGIANEKPYGYVDDQGNPTGEAVEVAKAVLAKMGITHVKATVVDFAALIPSLNAGKFDMVAAGMSILPARAKQALFSDPDYCAQTAFGVKAGNPLHLTDFTAVAHNSHARLGVETGAVEETLAKDAGVKTSQLQDYASTADLFNSLQAGRIDAAALTAPTVRTQVAGLGSGFEATPGFFPMLGGRQIKNCGGFVFRNSDSAFRNEFNGHLVQLKQANGILPIIERFGFTSSDTEAAKNLDVNGALAVAPPSS
jgi:polar amino acid transport system substrate-binding protein